MPITKDAIVISDLSGGRNGYDSPTGIPDDQCAEAYNVDFWDSPVGSRRYGASALAVTFSSGGPFAGSIGSLIRHVPGDDETAAELWAIDGNATTRFARLAGAVTWADVTLKDNLSAATDANNVFGASLNGFLFFAVKTAGGNRLHVWDPSLSKVRRVGLATPAAAPTGATDGGSGLTFSRVYRVRWVDVSGSDVRRQSEASAVLSASITDDAGYTVTRPTAASEDETHWDLEAADTTAGPFYRIARTAIATTTFDDTNATIPTTNLAPSDGINYPPPSAKFILATDARLVMANSWETSGGYVTPKNNRVWFTPVIGDNDIGDLERIPTGRYLDVDAAITGLALLDGEILVFSYRRMWRLVPTGIAATPYVKFSISPAVGCIRQQSVVVADDEYGSPCVYFLSHRGPYRYGKNGLQFLGADISDLWASNTPIISCNSLYHADKHQVWFHVGTSSTVTALRFVFDTRKGRVAEGASVRRGWTYQVGDSTITYASVMFSATVGASMSRDLKPYIAQGATTGAIWKCDDSQVNDDNGTTYGAYLDTRDFVPFGLGRFFAFTDPLIVMWSARNNSTFALTYTSDRTDTGTAVTESATVSWGTLNTLRFNTKVEGLDAAGLKSVSFRLGSATPGNAQFNIDMIHVPIQDGGPR